MTFHDELASLCAKEVNAAKKAGNTQRKSAVVEALAAILGRSVAVIADGDSRKIDSLLRGCESHAAVEAASFAPLIQLSASLRR